MTETTTPAARDVIRRLGKHLGDVIRDSGGPALFDTIERIRQLSVAEHRFGQPSADLAALLQSLPLDEAVHRLVRQAQTHQRNAEFEDDYTVVGIERVE